MLEIACETTRTFLCLGSSQTFLLHYFRKIHLNCSNLPKLKYRQLGTSSKQLQTLFRMFSKNWNKVFWSFRGLTEGILQVIWWNSGRISEIKVCKTKSAKSRGGLASCQFFMNSATLELKNYENWKYITWIDDTRWTCTGSFWKLRIRPRLEWITSKRKGDFTDLDGIGTEISAVWVFLIRNSVENAAKQRARREELCRSECSNQWKNFDRYAFSRFLF